MGQHTPFLPPGSDFPAGKGKIPALLHWDSHQLVRVHLLGAFTRAEPATTQAVLVQFLMRRAKGSLFPLSHLMDTAPALCNGSVLPGDAELWVGTGLSAPPAPLAKASHTKPAPGPVYGWQTACGREWQCQPVMEVTYDHPVSFGLLRHKSMGH